jgi:hypothetical protein
MRLRIPVVVALALTAAGCLDVSIPNSGRAGFMTVSTYDDGASAFVISPVAAFYASSGIAFDAPVAETCQLLAYAPVVNVPSSASTVDAGERVVLTLPLRVDTLLPQDEFGFQVYRHGAATGIAHAPGDTLRITVPGGTGFPAAALAVRTAEDFTHDPVGVVPQGEDMTITWTAAPEPGSIMLVSLRYANELSSGEINQQVRCSFTDDGSATIPGFLLTGWNATVGDQETVFTRMRTAQVELGGDARMMVLATFNRPLPPLPAPAQ